MNSYSKDLRRKKWWTLWNSTARKSEVASLFCVSLSGGFYMKFKHAMIGCVCLLVLGAFVVGGCTPDGEEETDQDTETGEETETGGEVETTEEPIATIGVEETEYSLYPEEVVLDSPGTYVFRAVNSGSTTHALKIEGQGIEEEMTENLAPDESAEFTVNFEPGSYEFYCPVGDHRDRGMEGTITVGEG
jgi:plastocyanin